MKGLSILTLMLLYSCASTQSSKTPPLHPTDGVIKMMRASFIRGCQKAHLDLKLSPSLEKCVEFSKDYIKEMKPML